MSQLVNIETDQLWFSHGTAASIDGSGSGGGGGNECSRKFRHQRQYWKEVQCGDENAVIVKLRTLSQHFLPIPLFRELLQELSHQKIKSRKIYYIFLFSLKHSFTIRFIKVLKSITIL